MRRASGRNSCEVAVIGAGPYGLAAAAHLHGADIETCVFGEAVSFWQRQMPRGMKLRSPWGATDIADPRGQFALDVFNRDGHLDNGAPLPLEDFVAYGKWFQKNAVPDLDTRRVVSVEQDGDGFRLRLDDDAVVRAPRVVIALGLANQEYRPAEFAGLPASLVSHACEHDDLAAFRGQRVAVIGRGQSGTESAALLNGGGAAAVTLIARGGINWLGEGRNPNPIRRMLARVLTPPSSVGPFPLNWMSELPGVVHHFPEASRLQFNARTLKAGAAGWLRPRFGNIRVEAGRQIVGATAGKDGVTLALDTGALTFDHVLLATGYRIDISRLGILSPGIMSRLERIGGSPRLGAGLEANLPGLHFVGSAAVASFGPLMRFIAGSGYAARALTRRIVAARAGQRAPASAAITDMARRVDVPR